MDENETTKKLFTEIDRGFRAGVEMAKNEPGAKRLIHQALKADKACKDREKFITRVVYQAFALGAIVQAFDEGMKHSEELVESEALNNEREPATKGDYEE